MRLLSRLRQGFSALLAPADDPRATTASPYQRQGELLARLRAALDEIGSSKRQLELRIEPIGKEIVERAASLRARSRGPRLPDALVLACGEVLEADAILTADRRWRRFERVLVIG